MPAYDLSTYNLGRVANVDVDALMIANQLVWEAETDPVDCTVFANSPISDVSSHNDSNPAAWLSSQFHRYSGADLEITAVGVYVPPGSSLAGNGGQVGLQFGETAYLNGHSYTNIMPATQVSTGVLIEGWNWINLSSPRLWDSAHPWVLAGYNFYERYLFNSTLTSSAIVSSPNAIFELVPAIMTTDQPGRSLYTLTGDQFQVLAAKTYSIDIRARLA
jgi:hypothetical protein